MSSSKKTKSESKSTSGIDPAQQALFMDNHARAMALADRPFQPFTGQAVADRAPAGLLADDMIMSAAPTVGMGTMQSAIDAAMRAANYKSKQVGQTVGVQYSPPAAAQMTAPNVRQAAAAQAANVARDDVRNLTTPSGLDGLDAYMNPYMKQVIDASLADIERQRQIQRVSDAQGATASKAFGGSRHGVADSLTNEAYGRTSAHTAAQLRAGGFDRAAGLLGMDRDRALQAQSANQNADLSVAGRNADFAQQANLRNAGAADEMARFRAALEAETGKFNAANALQAGAGNADRALRGLLADQQADQFGAEMNLRASGLLGGLSHAEIGQLLARSGMLGALGDTQQAQSQAKLDAQRAEFLREWEYPLFQQQLRNQALGMLPLTQIQTSRGTTKETTNPGALGYIQGFASLARSLGSGGLGWSPFV